jgi:putative protease
MGQIEAALGCGAAIVYADFEDVRGFRDAVSAVRILGETEIFLATPRIQKPSEEGFFKMIKTARPDGVLIPERGGPVVLSALFAANAGRLLAERGQSRGGSRFSGTWTRASHHLLRPQLGLLASSDSKRFELTIHQHIPMFHMEHCVFAAFFSKGASFLDCGRPCQRHRVHLRDRVGIEHPLRADVGCRNTLFNARAQTGAEYFQELRDSGLTHYRVELLEENKSETEAIVRAYRALLDEPVNGTHLWRRLKAQSQHGVTRGTFN